MIYDFDRKFNSTMVLEMSINIPTIGRVLENGHFLDIRF